MKSPRRDPTTGKLCLAYRKWSSMLQRCENQRHIAYRYYGGAGVRVSEDWHIYDAFHRDMGDPPPGTWLDRIDTSKGYEAGNCRWVTTHESAMNRKQRGQQSGSLADKARKAGLPYAVVYYRVRKYFWPEDEALSVPVHGERWR